MKIKTFFLFFFILFIYSLSYVKAQNNVLLGKKIYLDAGHGGKDPGAINNSTYEKDINLKITLMLKEELEKSGMIVYLTRKNDKSLDNNKLRDLAKRTNLINSSDVDFYISIHLNSVKNNSYRGAQVFYNKINKNNEKAAKIFQNLFQKELYSKRNYKQINDRYLYRRVRKPGLLLELGFLSNKNDLYLLKNENYQKKIIKLIKKGLIIYFK